MNSSLPHILLLGPARTAVSGVSTHLNQLFSSKLGACFRLSQFQVGSEGRAEGRFGILLRVLTRPFELTARLLLDRPSIVHINTSFEPKGYWRDLAYLAVGKLLRRKVVYQVHGGALPQEFFANSPVLTAHSSVECCPALTSWPSFPAATWRHITNSCPVRGSN
jgi:hypothetical protein